MKFYRKIISENDIKPSIFYLITSHHPPCQLNRTFRFVVFGHKIYICSRCLAQYIGIGIALAIMLTFLIDIQNIFQAIIVFGLFPLPATLDWLTQTISKRESNNGLRVSTGFLFGVSAGISIVITFIRFNRLAFFTMLSLYIVYILSVIYVLYKSKTIQNYLTPYEEFLSTIE